MGTEIPTRSRNIVRERDGGGQCRRCGCPGNQWHHRRRRRVGLGHDPHCPCNGVTTCGSCHAWIHSHPAEALSLGYIISASETEPWAIPVYLYSGDWILNSCEGGLDFTYDWAQGEDGGAPRRLADPWAGSSATDDLLAP